DAAKATRIEGLLDQLVKAIEVAEQEVSSRPVPVPEGCCFLCRRLPRFGEAQVALHAPVKPEVTPVAAAHPRRESIADLEDEVRAAINILPVVRQLRQQPLRVLRYLRERHEETRHTVGRHAVEPLIASLFAEGDTGGQHERRIETFEKDASTASGMKPGTISYLAAGYAGIM